MPELPEVETVRTALSKIISSSKVKSVEVLRKDLRWEIPEDLSEKLKDDILETPLRRGKYILIPTYKGNILLIHLGMSGQIKIQNTIPGFLKHDHVRIIIEKGNNKYYSITYNDPRRFGYIDLFKKKEINQHFLLKNGVIILLNYSFKLLSNSALISSKFKSIPSPFMKVVKNHFSQNLYRPYRCSNSKASCDYV